MDVFQKANIPDTPTISIGHAVHPMLHSDCLDAECLGILVLSRQHEHVLAWSGKSCIRTFMECGSGGTILFDLAFVVHGWKVEVSVQSIPSLVFGISCFWRPAHSIVRAWSVVSKLLQGTVDADGV